MPERVCKTCTLQGVWGCDAEETDELDQFGDKVWKNPAMVPLDLDGVMFWGCPRRPIKDDPQYWGKLLFYYAMYQKGVMPDEGAMASQSFKAMTLLGLLEDTMHECQQTKDSNHAAKMARHNS